MNTIVTKAQLVEHLNPEAISVVVGDGRWDMCIAKGVSLVATHVRLDRIPGGYLVRHGKYHELKALPNP